MSFVCKSIQIDNTNYYNNQAEMLMNKKMALKLQLPPSSRINISFGSCQTKAIVETTSGETPLLRISKTLAGKLAIPNGIQIHVRYDQNKNHLFFGPILGILVSQQHNRPDMKFGQLTPFCREVIQTAKARGIIAYVFSVKNINLEKETVKGWIYRNHSWVSATLPYPNAIYNRVGSRSQEKTTSIQNLIQGLKAKGCSIFNEQFLNKWHVYQALSTVPNLSHFIPETLSYQGFQSIKTMLQKYSTIYVKPTNGAMGRGIYRISKKNNGFLCQYSTLNGPVSRLFKTIGSLYQGITPRISKVPYLVQQGLHLIRQRDKPVDIRVLVQKNREGKWSVTSIVARTGSINNIVSNVARGGNVASVSQTLKHVSMLGAKPSVSSIKNAALQICNGLEKAIPGHYAELGVDLGIDTRGKVWLLEINSKPSKTDDTLHPSHHGPRPSVVRMLDYSLYLAGFPKETTNQRLRRSKSKSNRGKRKNRKKRR